MTKLKKQLIVGYNCIQNAHTKLLFKLIIRRIKRSINNIITIDQMYIINCCSLVQTDKHSQSQNLN
jgi:hypothetical protein